MVAGEESDCGVRGTRNNSGACHASLSQSETGRRLGSKWTESTTLAISEMLWLGDILAGIYRIVLAYLWSSPQHESRLGYRQTPRFHVRLCDSTASKRLVRFYVSDLQVRNSHSLSSLVTFISRRLIEAIISGTPGHAPRTAECSSAVITPQR